MDVRQMTDMSNWTEDEKEEYCKVLRKLLEHNLLSTHDLEKLSDNGKDALIAMYEGMIREAKPRRPFQKTTERFKRLFK